MKTILATALLLLSTAAQAMQDGGDNSRGSEPGISNGGSGNSEPKYKVVGDGHRSGQPTYRYVEGSAKADKGGSFNGGSSFGSCAGNNC